MNEVTKLLNEFKAVCADPRAQLDKALAEGRKCVGVLPYFCPEELVYAAGMLPIGLWGAEMQVNESKRYYPAFICSLLHTVLELGLKGALNGLTAVMVPICCDSLKGFSANWKYGVGESVPVIDVAWAENRKIAAGTEFTRAQFRKVLGRLEELARRSVSDTDISAAVAVYNENRSALRAFTAAAALHPEAVSPAERCAAIKAGYDTDERELRRVAEAVLSGAVKYCPHGRPVSVVMTRRDLDKLFKRIV